MSGGAGDSRASARGGKPGRFGNYVLEQRLGKGGMAEVWSARMGGVRGFEKMVCIKLVLPHVMADHDFVRMFVAEAKLSARLSHPNIVQVFDLGEVDGEFYMAMELVRGRDLLTLLRACDERGEPAPPAASACIARDVARALAYAHEFTDDSGEEQPIVHRDVSPQNVMVANDGIVKLVDFGIAKAMQSVGEHTKHGVVKGKLAYLAPELFDGQGASPQSDIFAAGTMLWEMLTGRRLFRGGSDFETLRKVRSMPIVAPSRHNRNVVPELDRIALKALERDRSLRYSRAALMARDLEQLCARENFSTDEMKQFLRELFPAGRDALAMSATLIDRPRTITSTAPGTEELEPSGTAELPPGERSSAAATRSRELRHRAALDQRAGDHLLVDPDALDREAAERGEDEDNESTAHVRLPRTEAHPTFDAQAARDTFEKEVARAAFDERNARGAGDPRSAPDGIERRKATAAIDEDASADFDQEYTLAPLPAPPLDRARTQPEITPPAITAAQHPAIFSIDESRLPANPLSRTLMLSPQTAEVVVPQGAPMPVAQLAPAPVTRAQPVVPASRLALVATLIAGAVALAVILLVLALHSSRGALPAASPGLPRAEPMVASPAPTPRIEPLTPPAAPRATTPATPAIAPRLDAQSTANGAPSPRPTVRKRAPAPRAKRPATGFPLFNDQ